MKFEQSTNAIVGEVVNLVRELLHSLDCYSVTPTGIQKSTGLNMKLSWKLSRLINAESLIAEAAHVPGPENQKTLLELAVKNQVPKDVRDRLADAFLRLEKHIESEAGNRQTFAAMTGAIGGGDTPAIIRKHRRDGYRANRQIIGLEANLQLATVIAGISKDDPDRLDAAAIQCGRGVRRTRPSKIPLVLTSTGVADERDDIPIQEQPSELIGDSYLIREFSTPGLPLPKQQGAAGYLQISLPGEEVGLKHAIDVSMGRIFRSYRPRHSVPGLTHVGPRMSVQWPTPLFVLDCIIDRRLRSDRGGAARVYAFRSEPIPGLIEIEEHLLEENLPISSLGQGLGAVGMPEFPEYRSLLLHTFDHLGADPEQFMVYRMRLEYPLFMSCITHYYYLPHTE